jgi:hypothetical protein
VDGCDVPEGKEALVLTAMWRMALERKASVRVYVRHSTLI